MDEKCSCCGKTLKELELEEILLFQPEDRGYERFEFGLNTYEYLCAECLEILEDEFSDMSHIIPNESEEDFHDTLNWDE